MDEVEKDYRLIDDPAMNSYVQAIGDRIAKHLPVSGIKFRFVIADVPDTNADTFPGGLIMVTRKMISFVHSEDELAAVIGHELGHATVHHGAIDWSKTFKQVLGVTSVGDRKDVFDKYHRYLEAYRTKKSGGSSRDHEDSQQLEADKIGVFAVYAAGYDPSAMTSFWKRLTNAKKTTLLSSLFGSSTPEDKRLEEMVNAVKTLPAPCLDKLSASTKADFDAWKSSVINYTGTGGHESLAGLMYRRPLGPLRSDIQHLRFSPDGNFILAQDYSTITVLKRDPLSVLFKVEVEGALPAEFSADSKALVVYSAGLRVQKWNLANQKLISTNEVSVTGGACLQTRISPDGNNFGCYKYNGDLYVYNVATGDEVFKEKDFYRPTDLEARWWTLVMEAYDISEYGALNMEFSPDGKYFLAGRKSETGTFGFGELGFDRQVTIAVDLTTHKKVSIGDNVKNLLVTSMDFVGPDKVVGQYSGDVKKSGIFSFPAGDRLGQFDLAGQNFMAGYSGDFMTVRPVSGAAGGLFDLNQKKFLFGNAKGAMDVYDKTFVTEMRDGEVGLFNVDTRENFASVALPPSPFGDLRATALSADGNWLVVSDRSRGAAWDLRTGERKIHIRAFKGAFITPDAKVYSDFPRQLTTERSIAIMDLQNSTVGALGDMASQANIRQFGRYLLIRKPLHEKPDKPETEEEKKKHPFSEEGREKPLPAKEMQMEMRDVRTGALLWKREFPNERPAVSISSIHDTMLFGWALNSDAANEIITASPALKTKRDTMGSKTGDQLIELIDPKTGQTKGDFLLETGERSFRPEYLTWAGDYLVVNDNHNRVLLFSSANGDLQTRFFGNYAAVSTTTKQIAVENAPGRVMLADIPTGKELGRLSFTHPVTLMQYTDGGQHLFVLTSDQTAFMFDVSKIPAEEPTAQKN